GDLRCAEPPGYLDSPHEVTPGKGVPAPDQGKFGWLGEFSGHRAEQPRQAETRSRLPCHIGTGRAGRVNVDERRSHRIVPVPWCVEPRFVAARPTGIVGTIIPETPAQWPPRTVR